MYTLLIDGNFFGYRMLKALNLSFMKDPKTDKKLLFDGLTESLANEVKPLENIIDSIVFARDYTSWRKLKTPTIAPEIMEDLEADEIKYKANRDKVEKTHDDKLYFEAFDEWCTMIEESLGIPVIKTKYSEADDAIYVISLLLNNKGKKTIMWSSDGDFLHMVNKDNSLIKLPKKELVIMGGAKEQKSVTMESLFSDKKPDRSGLLLNVFQGVTVEINPMKSLLIKLICGDKKDNVYAVFQWNAKTGTRKYKPTEKKMETALGRIGESLDTITMEQVYDHVFVRKFLTELLSVCKQVRDLDSLLEIYHWNLKAKHLHKRQIPIEVIKGVYKNFQSKKGIIPDWEAMKSKTSMLEKFNIIEVGTFFDGVEIMDY